MKEYKGIIDKLIKDSYEESLVIDVFNDKIYKYAYVNDDIVKLEELSYADYLNKCNSFIYGDILVFGSIHLNQITVKHRKVCFVPFFQNTHAVIPAYRLGCNIRR